MSRRDRTSPPPPRLKVEDTSSPEPLYRPSPLPPGVPGVVLTTLPMEHHLGYTPQMLEVLTSGRPSLRLSPIPRQGLIMSQPAAVPILRGSGLVSLTPGSLHPSIITTGSPTSPPRQGQLLLPLGARSPSQQAMHMHLVGSTSPVHMHRTSPAPHIVEQLHKSPSISPHGLTLSASGGLLRRASPVQPSQIRSSPSPNHYLRTSPPPSSQSRTSPAPPSFLHTSPAPGMYVKSSAGQTSLWPSPGQLSTRASPGQSSHLHAFSGPAQHPRSSPVPPAHSRTTVSNPDYSRGSPGQSKPTGGSPLQAADLRTSPVPPTCLRTSPAPATHLRASPVSSSSLRVSPGPPAHLWAASQHARSSPALAAQLRASPKPQSASAGQPIIFTVKGASLAPQGHRMSPAPPVNRTSPAPPAHMTSPAPPVHRTSPAPPSHRTSPAPPVHMTSPAPPVHRTSPAPPAQRMSPAPPVHRTSPAPPALRTSPAPPAHRISPAPPAYRVSSSPPPAHRKASPIPTAAHGGDLHRAAPQQDRYWNLAAGGGGLPGRLSPGKAQDGGRGSQTPPTQHGMPLTKAEMKGVPRVLVTQRLVEGGSGDKVIIVTKPEKAASARAASPPHQTSQALVHLLKMRNPQMGTGKSSTEVMQGVADKTSTPFFTTVHKQPTLPVSTGNPSNQLSGSGPPPLLSISSLGPDALKGVSRIGGKAISGIAQAIKQEADLDVQDAMPRLMPEMIPARGRSGAGGLLLGGQMVVKEEQEEDDEDLLKMENPFNMRVVSLNSFPVKDACRPGRSQTLAIHRAKVGCITSTARSLDLLRQNLQKFLNKDIDDIIQKYLEEFFKPGIENMRMNNGDGSVTEDHIHAVCRQMLEEAKKMYQSESRSATPDNLDNVSETGSLLENRGVRDRKNQLFNIKKRRGSSDSDVSGPKRIKRKGRPPLHLQGSTGRSTPSKTGKNDVVKKEGPKWDPERLTTETQFVMGARANKALGHGSQRGRLYMKHPDVFKYSGDQDDKVWLYENHHMPATGGKAYLLLVDDIRELAESDEYKNSPELMLNDVIGFSVPEWMLDKMKAQMQALRTDVNKGPKHIRSRSATPNNNNGNGANPTVTDELDERLPFSRMSTTPQKSLSDSKSDNQPSPSSNLDLMQDDDDPSSISPLHMTGGYGDVSPAPDMSPTPSDFEPMDDDPPPITTAFHMN